MGHGDDIAIVDANFPADSAGAAAGPPCRASPRPTRSRAVLSLLPLDDFVDQPAAAMDAPGERPPIYPEFEAALAAAEGRPADAGAGQSASPLRTHEAAYAVIAPASAILRQYHPEKGVLRS